MADPKAALATQIRNIEAKTGKSLTELGRLIERSGLAKVGEQRSMLMKELGLGYGDANTVAMLVKNAASAGSTAPNADPLDGIYSGAKAHLRPLHERVIAAIAGFGPYEKAPKKTYVSLRRKKQFATVGPATRSQIEIGLNARGLQGARLKVLPPGDMCQYSVRLEGPDEIDPELIGWLRAAYSAAG